MMLTTRKPADRQKVGPEPPAAVSAELLSVRDVAALLGGCSTRHVYRLSDSGAMPRPLKLGSLLRWRRTEVMNWIDGGCQPLQPSKATGR